MIKNIVILSVVVGILGLVVFVGLKRGKHPVQSVVDFLVYIMNRIAGILDPANRNR